MLTMYSSNFTQPTVERSVVSPQQRECITQLCHTYKKLKAQVDHMVEQSVHILETMRNHEREKPIDFVSPHAMPVPILLSLTDSADAHQVDVKKIPFALPRLKTEQSSVVVHRKRKRSRLIRDTRDAQEIEMLERLMYHNHMLLLGTDVSKGLGERANANPETVQFISHHQQMIAQLTNELKLVGKKQL